MLVRSACFGDLTRQQRGFRRTFSKTRVATITVQYTRVSQRSVKDKSHKSVPQSVLQEIYLVTGSYQVGGHRS